MKTLSLALCFSALSMMAACAPAGYYDSNGVYRSYGASDSFRNDKPMAGTPNTYGEHPDYYASPAPVPAGGTTTVIYDRPGYYDSNGYYIASGPNAPEAMFPPRGMCRVWFTDSRPASEQPAVESCNGIRQRVPVGAYVIYGG